jgi:hypothetical protein
MGMSDRAGAVFDVAAEEALLRYDQVVALLVATRLRSTGLVDENGRWTTPADSMVFEEHARPHAVSEGAVRTLTHIFMALAGIGLRVGYFLLRWFARHHS